MVAFFAPMRHYVVPTTLYDVIKHLGQETSLTWVIDAGDAASIASASDQSLGLIPPGGSQIVRGNDTGVDADRDPVHRGTIGGQSLSEYWEMDNRPAPTPSRRFSATSGAWWEPLHKDGAVFSLAGWAEISAIASNYETFLTTGKAATTTIGVSVGLAVTSGYLRFEVANGSGTAYALTAESTMAPSLATPFFWAISYDEAAGAGFFQLNGTQQAISGTYSSPSAGASTFGVPLIAVGTDSTVGAQQLNKLFNASFWSRALTTTEATALYNMQKAKFGL